MIRVLLIAPTPMLRAGLHSLLAASPCLEIVGEATGFTPQLEAIAEADVVVLADELLLHEAARAVPADGTLALVVLADDSNVVSSVRALPLRGWAVLPTEASGSELQAAIEGAAHGLAIMPLPIANRLLSPRTTLEAPSEPLTPREREVLDLLGQGLSNKLIARHLTISEHTVKFHVAAIFTKLGASSRADAVSRGARSGLITL